MVSFTKLEGTEEEQQRQKTIDILDMGELQEQFPVVNGGYTYKSYAEVRHVNWKHWEYRFKHHQHKGN